MSDDVFAPLEPVILRSLLYPKKPKKPVRNRLETRIKILNIDNNGKDTNLNAMKVSFSQ